MIGRAPGRHDRHLERESIAEGRSAFDSRIPLPAKIMAASTG
jgi:hypothetical protein